MITASTETAPSTGRLALAALILISLAGCGQKGPLYLPDDEAAAERYGATPQSEQAEKDADEGTN